MITGAAILAFLDKFKWYIASGLLVVALVVGGKIWIDNKTEAAYQQGVTQTDQKWKKAQDEKDKKDAAFKAGQQANVDSLRSQLAEAQAKLQDPARNGGEKQIIYVNTTQGKSKSLDNSFISIYNDSLGKKK